MSKALRTTAQAEPQEDSAGVVRDSALMITSRAQVIRFNGRAMVMQRFEIPGVGDFDQYVPLHKETFEELAYPILGGVSRSRIADVFAYVINTAPDCSERAHLVLLGHRVWDTRELRFRDDIDPDSVVWRSPWSPLPASGPVPFVLALAGGDLGHYEDIVQSMAPLLMEAKPDGVVWWVGQGANGKSSLMEALYRLFPGQLASLTVKRLTDERDTPMLNGHLANVVKESSEGRIDDTQVYKSCGTHEDFRVHKFHSQESVVIKGNMHHIFSANQIPVFNDKGYSARRRTFVIPFRETFDSDPGFNGRTFTKETLGRLLSEMLRLGSEIASRGARYKFSQVTDSAKVEYDAEANNAEDYARGLKLEGVVGFDGFDYIRADYERWCGREGYVPLGMGNLRRSVQAVGFERRTVRAGSGYANRYVLSEVNPSEMTPMPFSRMGFYTAPGFEAKADVPLSEMAAEHERKQATLGDWTAREEAGE